jgi:O-antigen/teichoic acid export membrane protein
MTDGPAELKDLRAATLRGLRWVMIARPLVECMLLGSMVALARLIPPVEFGHFATAMVISGFGAASVSAITTALVQRATLERHHLEAANALALASGAVLVGLSFLAADLVVVPIFGERTADLVRLSAPGALIAAAGAVSFATLQRRLAFRRLTVIDVTGSGLRGLGAVVLAVMGLDGTALVLGALAGTLAQTGLAWLWARPPLPRVHVQSTRDLLHYGIPNWLAAVSWIGFANCDYAIVGARLGALQAGLYFRAYTLAVEYQKKISHVMASVGLPVLARTRSGEDMDALRSQMVSLLTVLLFPCLALLAVTAPVAVPAVFGSEWRPAVGPTQVLAIGGCATIVIDAVGTTLMAAGRPRAVLAFGWGHFVAYAGVVLLAAPFGLLAVASGAAAVHTAFVFVAYALLHRSAGRWVLRRIWQEMAPAVVASGALVATSLAAGSALSSLGAPAGVQLVVVVAVGACTYLALLRARYVATWQVVLHFVRHLLPERVRRRRSARPLVERVSVPASAED